MRYQGEKSPAIMMALFKKPVSTTVQQEPVIALSDGKTNVKLIAALPPSAGTSPNFAFSEARMISLNKDESSDKWILEVLPQKGTFKATATVLYGNTIVEYPLTVVPPIREATAIEADFVRFLKDSGSSYPQFDFNNDGRHDHIDDFIYTANFLVLRNSPKSARPAKK